MAKQKIAVGNAEDGCWCEVRINNEMIENIANLDVSWENMLH